MYNVIYESDVFEWLEGGTGVLFLLLVQVLVPVFCLKSFCPNSRWPMENPNLWLITINSKNNTSTLEGAWRVRLRAGQVCEERQALCPIIVDNNNSDKSNNNNDSSHRIARAELCSYEELCATLTKLT